MLHSIHIRPLARNDIRAAFEWIEKLVSTESAIRWHGGLHARIESLRVRPETWPEADESNGLDFILRMILYRRHRHVYRILFEIEGDKVVVHRVRHAAQDSLTAEDF